MDTKKVVVGESVTDAMRKYFGKPNAKSWTKKEILQWVNYVRAK